MQTEVFRVSLAPPTGSANLPDDGLPPHRAHGLGLQPDPRRAENVPSERDTQQDEISPTPKASTLSSGRFERGHMERSTYIAPETFRSEDTPPDFSPPSRSLSIHRKTILETQNALGIPPRAVRDSLFESFWTYCYPWYPIVDKSHLFGKSSEEVSPLLLQAIFLAGSRTSPTPSSYATPEDFYNRAKTLFWLNHEENPLTVLTAVSLLDWWNPCGPEQVSTDTATFWHRIAVSLAQQMGWHSQKKFVQEESLRKRIWWSLVARDRLISASHGRPPGIDLDDCSVARLKVDDFLNSPPAVGHIFIAYVDLSLILGQLTKNIMRNTRAKSYLVDAENSLYRWVKTLPESLRLRRKILKNNLLLPEEPYSFEARQIHVLYLVIVILLYRPLTVNDPFPTATALAASTIAGIFEDFIARDEVRLLGPMFTFYLLTAGIALLSCYRFPLLWSTAEEDLKTFQKAQDQLKKTWQSAVGSIRTFEKMQKVAMTMQQHFQGGPGGNLTTAQGLFFEDIDTDLCRLWDILHDSAAMSPTGFEYYVGGANLTDHHLAHECVSFYKSPNAAPDQPTTPFNVADAGELPGFDDLFFNGGDQMHSWVGDWLLSEQPSLNVE